MKNVYFLMLLLVFPFSFVACDDVFEEYPININVSGEYAYQGNSTYYNSYGSVEYEGSSEGVLENYGSSFYITPKIGWSYEVKYSNSIVLNLGDGKSVTAFTIHSQTEYVNEFSYDIAGAKKYNMVNTVGVSLGTYDGYIDGNKIYISYSSTNTTNFNSAVTEIIAER